MEKENKGCCQCTEDLKKEVDELIENVDGYTEKDHREKEEEVKAAFADKKPEK